MAAISFIHRKFTKMKKEESKIDHTPGWSRLKHAHHAKRHIENLVITRPIAARVIQKTFKIYLKKKQGLLAPDTTKTSTLTTSDDKLNIASSSTKEVDDCLNTPDKKTESKSVAGIPTEYLERIFNKLDHDKDGFLSKKEVGKFAKEFHEKITSFFGGNSLAAGFEEMDRTKRGKVSFDDVIWWHRLHHPETEEEVESQIHFLFNEIDTKGTKTLNKAEVGKLAAKMGDRLKGFFGFSHKKLDLAFVQMSQIGSSVVTFEEFLAWHKFKHPKLYKKLASHNKDIQESHDKDQTNTQTHTLVTGDLPPQDVVMKTQTSIVGKTSFHPPKTMNEIILQTKILFDEVDKKKCGRLTISQMNDLAKKLGYHLERYFGFSKKKLLAAFADMSLEGSSTVTFEEFILWHKMYHPEVYAEVPDLHGTKRITGINSLMSKCSVAGIPTEHFRLIFTELDTDNDGLLSEKEVGKFAKEFHEKITSFFGGNSLKDGFREMDRKQMGRVSFNDLISWHRKHHPETEDEITSQVQFLFNHVDQEKSGFLNKKEVGKLASKMGYRLKGFFGINHQKLDIAFSEMVKPGESRVTFDQFIKWHKIHHPEVYRMVKKHIPVNLKARQCEEDRPIKKSCEEDRPIKTSCEEDRPIKTSTTANVKVDVDTWTATTCAHLEDALSANTSRKHIHHDVNTLLNDLPADLSASLQVAMSMKNKAISRLNVEMENKEILSGALKYLRKNNLIPPKSSHITADTSKGEFPELPGVHSIFTIALRKIHDCLSSVSVLSELSDCDTENTGLLDTSTVFQKLDKHLRFPPLEKAAVFLLIDPNGEGKVPYKDLPNIIPQIPKPVKCSSSNEYLHVNKKVENITSSSDNIAGKTPMKLSPKNIGSVSVTHENLPVEAPPREIENLPLTFERLPFKKSLKSSPTKIGHEKLRLKKSLKSSPTKIEDLPLTFEKLPLKKSLKSPPTKIEDLSVELEKLKKNLQVKLKAFLSE